MFCFLLPVSSPLEEDCINGRNCQAGNKTYLLLLFYCMSENKKIVYYISQKEDTLNQINLGEVPLLRGGHVRWIRLISLQNIAQQMPSAGRVRKITRSWTSMSCAVFRNVSSVTQKNRTESWGSTFETQGEDLITLCRVIISEGRWFAPTVCQHWDCGICFPQSWQLAGTCSPAAAAKS